MPFCTLNQLRYCPTGESAGNFVANCWKLRCKLLFQVETVPKRAFFVNNRYSVYCKLVYLWTLVLTFFLVLGILKKEVH